MKIKALFFSLLISSLLLAENKANNDNEISKPSKPSGVGYELTVDIPAVNFPLPVVDNGGNNKYDSTKYTLNNPIVKILYGFDSIWSLNDSSWQNGNADGNGPDDFANATIRNATIWKENIQYVVNVTNDRTEAQALAAYYDDCRDMCYSVIDGFGPLEDAYITGSGAYTTVDYSNDENFDVNAVMEYTARDTGFVGLGNTDSELSDLSNIVLLLRQKSPASTSAAKLFYISPRPWRMNDEGEVIPLDEDGDGEIDLETIGGVDFEKYETSVSFVPALKIFRKKASYGRRKDGGFPSGHTNAGYLAAIGFAYAVPERFSELLTRASELGEDRLVAGMHSPLDVIGGRIQAEAIAAYALSKAENKEAILAAYKNAGECFGALAKEKGLTLYEFAHTNDTGDWADNDANKALYRKRMTYGFSKTGKSGVAPVVPKGAEVLLETRQPYLTADQRRAVLYTTAIESGYPVVDESNGWGRLDYVKAADGYGAFIGDVTVCMDSSKGRFNAHDWWKNDISGTGLLTKDGSGTLTLTGNNSYSGGTLLKGGTLEAESATALGLGDVYIENGTILVNSDSPLVLNSNFTMDGGTLSIAMDKDSDQIIANGIVYLDGGNLELDFSGYPIKNAADITIITADFVTGEFDRVTADGYTVTVTYNDNSIVVHVKN